MDRDELNRLTQKIIGAAIEVHRHLGPGLLESTYESCLVYELEKLGLKVERQKILPVIYIAQKRHSPFCHGLRKEHRDTLGRHGDHREL